MPKRIAAAAAVSNYFLDKHINRQAEAGGEFVGLGFADLAFAVQDERDGSLRTEDVEHVDSVSGCAQRIISGS